MSRLYLCDISAIAIWLYKSRLATVGPEFDDAGLACGMLLGVHDWFVDLYEKFQPTYIAACLDGANNWRKERYAEYKANRPEKEEDLVAQLRMLPNELAGLGLPIIRHTGFEGDDVIATLAARHCDEREVMIVTTDKDMLQLVSDSVSVFDPRGGLLFDAAGVVDKHGVPPHRMRDYLALMGDSSDNVPGVTGVGKKFAAAAVAQTRSLPELVRKAAAGALKGIKAAPQAAIAASSASGELALWHELVGLRFDVPVTETIDDLRLAQPGQCPKSVTSAA